MVKTVVLEVRQSLVLSVNVFFLFCFVILATSSYTFRFSSVQSLNHVWLFATPWTEACQSPLSMVLWDPSKNTGVGCHFLLQGIFPIQDSNPLTNISCGSCIGRWILYHWTKPRVMVEESLPFIQSQETILVWNETSKAVCKIKKIGKETYKPENEQLKASWTWEVVMSRNGQDAG